MGYWYGYTGQELVSGQGNTIRNVMPNTHVLQRLISVADEQYQRYARVLRQHGVSAKTFTAALLAPLSVQEFGMENPSTQFSSAGQVLRLFDGLNIEQVAVNLLNGRTASRYSDSDPAGMVTRVAKGFANGELLTLPADAKRLHTQETMNALPGAVAFLLSHFQAQHKAFAGYLRRGTASMVPIETKKTIAKGRPVPDMGARGTYRQRRKKRMIKSSNPQALIDHAMRQAPRFATNAAAEHLQAFTMQMRQKLGVETIALKEPYLPLLLARCELKYLRRMDRLRQRFVSTKALQITIPDPANLTPQDGDDVLSDDNQSADDHIASESNRAAIEAKQDLDGARQQAFGINRYIWHTDGESCPECAPYDGEIFTWDEGEEPGSIHPNCQCSAEPVLDGAEIDDPPIEPVYPIEDLVGLLAGGGLARQLGMAAIRRARGGEEEPSSNPQEPTGQTKPQMDDTNTWPKPPRDGKFAEGVPSRSKPAGRGEKSLYDEEGGEWRYAPEDKYHNEHWDYKPEGQGSPWENVPIGDKPPVK